MDRWNGKLAVVTGASSGIGEAISKILVLKGVNVLGLARREDKLKQLSKSLEGNKGSFYFMRCDLQNEKDILDAFAYAEKIFGGVDILINNAGIVRRNNFTDFKTEDFRDVLEINILACSIFSREALKSMRKHKNEGHIVFINSVAGRTSKTNHFIEIGLYPASKFALRAMTDNLRSEVAQKKDNIRLTTIYPGLVKTEIIGDINKFDELVKGQLYLNSEDIADSVVYALSAPPHVQVEDLVITPLHNLL